MRSAVKEFAETLSPAAQSAELASEQMSRQHDAVGGFNVKHKKEPVTIGNELSSVPGQYSCCGKQGHQAITCSLRKLGKAVFTLSCYLGKITVLGVLQMQACYKAVTVDCDLIGLNCEGPSRCSRRLLQKLRTQGASHSSKVKLERREAAPVTRLYADLFTQRAGTNQGASHTAAYKRGRNPRVLQKFHFLCWIKSLPS